MNQGIVPLDNKAATDPPRDQDSETESDQGESQPTDKGGNPSIDQDSKVTDDNGPINQAVNANPSTKKDQKVSSDQNRMPLTIQNGDQLTNQGTDQDRTPAKSPQPLNKNVHSVKKSRDQFNTPGQNKANQGNPSTNKDRADQDSMVVCDNNPPKNQIVVDNLPKDHDAVPPDKDGDSQTGQVATGHLPAHHQDGNSPTNQDYQFMVNNMKHLYKCTIAYLKLVLCCIVSNVDGKCTECLSSWYCLFR